MKTIKQAGYYSVILLQRLMSFFPIDFHKVFVINHYGKGYGDNGRYIIEALYEEDPSYQVVWPIRKEIERAGFPSNVKVVPYYSLSFFYHLMTAGIRISNVRLPWFLKKRKEQYYIQCWHGSNALKCVEKDVIDVLSDRYVKSAILDARNSDLMVSNSRWWTSLIRRSFWYDGEILDCGTPRLRAIYQDREKNRIKFLQENGLTEDTKLLLYAPTFRADFKLNHYTLDYEEVLNSCEEHFGGNWVAGIRLHPNLKGHIDYSKEDCELLDLTDYPDIYEIMASTDLLITDYSGIMFEAGVAGIKVLLYADDVDEYTKDRGFYFDIRSLPYPLAETTAQAVKIINEWNEEQYQEENKEFEDNLGIKEDGTGAKVIAKRIVEYNQQRSTN